jgi:hypothetical protein
VINKDIIFSAPESYLKQKQDYPEPCKLNIPEWYKEIQHTPELATVKGCIPFLDTLTSGYLLKTPVDLYLEHNQYEENGRYTKMSSSVIDLSIPINVNREKHQQIHPPEQLGKKCPFHQKNQNLPFHKILNPWIIKTPPGYSCLFLPPMNNGDDRFSILPGIVDTDTYESEVNFPIIVNGDKYPVSKTLIKKGTPYVQVIPFKRESWKMKIKSNSKLIERLFYQSFTKLHTYKTRWWNKKSWK